MVSLDVKFINPFINAAIDTIKQFANLESIVNEKPRLVLGADMNTDISGVLSIKSANFKGLFVISFPVKTYLGLVNNILGESYTCITSSNSDTAGEIANLVYSHAKRELNEMGYKLDMIIPSVVMGDDHTKLPSQALRYIAIKFKTNLGYFDILIGVEKQSLS